MSRTRVICEFAREEDLVGAAEAARDRGMEIEDAYTPYAVHGLAAAMGLAHSRLPRVTLVLGLLGAASFLAFQYWASAISWPTNVGGRPWNSLPAFVPVTFEVMVLFAGVGTVIAFLVVTGHHPGRRPRSSVPGVTDDRFALVIMINGDRTDLAAIEELMSPFMPASISEEALDTSAAGGAS